MVQFQSFASWEALQAYVRSGARAESMPLGIRRDQWASDPEYAAQLKSERIQRKDHSFDPRLPTWYGGGFWDQVAIGPAPGVEPAGVCAELAVKLGDRGDRPQAASFSLHASGRGRDPSR